MEKGNVLSYKGYYTKIKYDSETCKIVGKVEGINDLVFFESDNANDIIREFHSAVDDYLSFCEDNQLEPDKAYKGTFNVRIDTDLHKRLSLLAYKNDETLNSLVEKSIRYYLDYKPQLLVEQLRETIYDQFASINIENHNLPKWKTLDAMPEFSPATYSKTCA